MARLWCFLLVFSLSSGVINSVPSCNFTHATEIYNAVLRTLHYADANIAEFNLDGAMSMRLVSDQAKVLMDVMSNGNYPGKHDILLKLNYLKDLASSIATEAIPFLHVSDPHYFNGYGSLLTPDLWLLQYYRERTVNKGLLRKPVPCKDSEWTNSPSGKCLLEFVPYCPGHPSTGACNISNACIQAMMNPTTRDYTLTHQVFYLQIAEMCGCLPTIEKAGYSRAKIISWQEDFCANIYRDAEEISRFYYPETHGDLFLEQVGLCGMYGFTDFWRDDWIRQALYWQEPNGCFVQPAPWKCNDDMSSHIRVKREDKMLSDGCSSHKTGVGVMALFTNLRFCLVSILKASAQP